jgi:putative ABC transport system substrate-binding protein
VNRRDLLGVLGGIAVFGPPVAGAQQRVVPVIGWLSGTSPEPAAPNLAAFNQGLAETGYVAGQNLAIEYRWAETHYDRLPELAADLVARNVDIIAATGGDLSARAAKQASSKIPIVASLAADPVKAGLAASLAHPGGNLTGVSFLTVELHPKRLELLSDLVPNVKVIALLVNPTNPNNGPRIRSVEEAARARGIRIHVLEGANGNEIDTAFASLSRLRAGALIVSTDPFIESRREQILALAARYAIPAIYGFRDIATAGGLISYGPSLTRVYRQLGVYAGRILHGERPADLPVQQPTTFELVINLKTAKALGITVPQSLLARADEVIE